MNLAVRFSFLSTVPRDWLGRTSPKWLILCRVGHKTWTQSIPLQLVLSASGWFYLVVICTFAFL